ncbi:MAG: hypothetical protein PGN16_06445 [Sphingomonas phyllosphaerae]|uniref:hypothetical protein n=1 Tax=Sphingomonas phyllosphaerae TaxID=257003 RepID=UPI002FFA2F88
MYDLIDHPVKDLPAFEHRTLMRLRRWVHAFSHSMAPTAAFSDDPFGKAMRLIDEGSSGDLLILRPCHDTVGESEAILVALWRLTRSGSDASARALAGGLVDATRTDRLVSAISASLAH